MKASYIVATIIVMVLLVASPVYLLLGNSQPRPVGSKAYWRALATDAWEYFQPGKGVDFTTGLHSAAIGYPYFTDWDLGVYIQAIIDAEKLGILASDGIWDSETKIDKILEFLENRELTDDGVPFSWYQSRTGERYGDSSHNVADTGKLLSALQNLRLFKPELAERINRVVYERTNYSYTKGLGTLAGSINIYDYYIVSGFASFWPELLDPVADAILNNIITAPQIETYGVELPVSKISCEPLFHSIFDLKPDQRLLDLANKVYKAHEARYNETGKFVAFSEGNTGLDEPSYAYEWVVLPDGRTWVMQDSASLDIQTTPIAYLKIAVGFLAVYNTEFTRNMTGYIVSRIPEPTNGYADGMDENGRLVTTIVDKTNGMIIAAARYAVENGDFGISSWQNYDMSFFPWPFVRDGVVNNISVVVGESQPHDSVGAAQTTDIVGGMLIMEMLGRESSNGTLNAAIDSWLVKHDSNSGGVTLLDNTTNLIIVGSPGINALSYCFNGLRDQFEESLVPVQYVISDESYSYLYVPNSGSIYKTEFDEQGKKIADYGVIMGFQDQFNRYVVMVYGLGPEATLGACNVLKEYDQWGLYGSATILKFYIDRPGNYPTNSSVVEVVA